MISAISQLGSNISAIMFFFSLSGILVKRQFAKKPYLCKGRRHEDGRLSHTNVQMLSIDGLTTGYARRGRARAVGKRLTATAPRGTLTVVCGVNGAGKSTLLRTLAGLQPPIGGKVEIGGGDIASLRPRDLARLVAVVLTQLPPGIGLTAGEVAGMGRMPYTAFGGSLAEADRKIVKEAMVRVGAEKFFDRRIASLSDGERQRVMIAKALAQQTPVVLLDEPTAFLDPPGKVAALRLLQSLAHNEGKTILFTSHDLNLSLKTADNAWLLTADGGIVSGTPQELKNSGALVREFGEWE